MYPQIFGKYVLERELAIGGMARVALATLRGAGGFEKKLVVKQIRDELSLDEEFIRRFVEEAKTTVALSHPNIVPVYELGVEQGTYFLAMEYVDGVSVDALLKTETGERRGLSPEEGAYLGVEVCRALDYAHRRMDVVHRDITPRNVMVDEEGQVKVIDFGIAARASVAGHDVFGTPGHMPPEQLDKLELRPATDIFALAVLLMEVWNGSPPFRRKTPAESLAQMRAPHPKPSESDARLLPLDATMASAMALDPLARPQSADDLGRPLRRFLQDVDLGDVARKLGARVREARAVLAKKAAKKKGSESLFKPSRPTMDLRPKTFAAREEVENWAPDQKAPAAQEPEQGTRKMAESLPAAEEVLPVGPPSSVKIETVATRPIETPVSLPAELAATKAPRRRGLIVGGAGVVVVAAALFVLRGQQEDGVTPTKPLSSAGSTATTPSGNVPPGPPSATGSAGGPLAGHPLPGVSTAMTSRPVPTPSDATSAPHVAGAQLVLVGDPGTQVSVDGSAYRPCPAVIAAKVGSHSVRFLFEPTHEERGQPVKVGSGDRVTVRADFAAATPTIRVER